MNMFKKILDFFAPEVSNKEERYTRNFQWTVFSKYARRVLRGQKEFNLTFEDYDLIKEILNYYRTDIFTQKRLDRWGKYKQNPHDGIKDIRIGIDPNNQQALMWVQLRK